MIQTLANALSERGYDKLTPVQEAVTNPELEGSDLLVSAQTGSGKTVGFGLAIGPTLLEEDGTFGPAAAPLALIVAPTRELAFQVSRELGWLYAGAGARVSTCVGGMDMRDERRALERGAHIVVGTPGRLVDHIKRGSLELGDIRAVVLDEADEMLDLGFREDLEFMLGEAPAERRTLLFSATVPPMIAKLAQQFQRDAVRVTTLGEARQHADITYQALRVADADAEHAIINVLRYHEAQNAIVFANTRATVSRLTARFANRGFSVVSLSGELSQTERSHALQAMRDGRARVCVATDVAARGIDLPNLELVIHAELPSNSETLLHRSGRTGRAGRKGTSALVVPPKFVKKAERLLKFAKITAEWATAPTAEEILRRDEERLLSDPAWSEPITENEAEFAARLLDAQSPEQIAAAYLRLFRSRHSAPEELSDPDTRPAPRERAPFGPSAWISLSVGRNDRAEPRWLLPMLCRAGGLDKDQIGAIRIRPTETFVEISEPALQGFLGGLNAGGELERGVKARAADGPPEDDRRGPPPNRDKRPPRPRDDARSDSRPPRKPAREEAASEASDAPRTEPVREEAPRPRRDDEVHRPRKPREATDRRSGDTGKPGPKKSFGGKPSGPKGRFGDGEGKPRFRDGDKPKRRDGDKPRGRDGDKPAFKGKPKAEDRACASDTSKRFEPPHRAGAKSGKPGGKPSGKPGGKGGPKGGFKGGPKGGKKPFGGDARPKRRDS